MILNCYIIDDEPLAIRLLESYVDKTPFLRLQGSCTNAVTALADLSERPVDLLFLDIQMPELNGLEFSKIIGDRCRIIFTTAFEQYAVDTGFRGGPPGGVQRHRRGGPVLRPCVPSVPFRNGMSGTTPHS